MYWGGADGGVCSVQEALCGVMAALLGSAPQVSPTRIRSLCLEVPLPLALQQQPALTVLRLYVPPPLSPFRFCDIPEFGITKEKTGQVGLDEGVGDSRLFLVLISLQSALHG